MENIEVIILAGGFGRRLHQVVPDRPKVLADINGRPFALFLLDQLVDAGIGRVLFCTGYLGEHVEEVVGHQYRTLTVAYSREDTPLGTGGALRNARNMIQNEVVLVTNGDSFVDIDYQDFVSWHYGKMSKMSIIVVSIEKPDRYGVVDLDRDQKIIRFSEKRPLSIKGPAYINAGVYLIHRSVIENFPSKNNLSLEDEVLPSLIPDGIFGYVSTGPFIDIGTPKSLHSAEAFFTERKNNNFTSTSYI